MSLGRRAYDLSMHPAGDGRSYGNWVELPEPARSADLSRLREALDGEDVVTAAWLGANRWRTADGVGRVELAFAFVLDEPRRAADHPAMTELIARLHPITSELGLDVRRWAFVSADSVEREIAANSLRVI
jgi:hypothetical protein